MRVSVTFRLPVWPQMAVGGLFSPVICVLRCVDSRLGQSATGRQPTTGILLPVQMEVNIQHRRISGVLFCRIADLPVVGAADNVDISQS